MPEWMQTFWKRCESRYSGTLVLYALFLDKNLAGDIVTDRTLGRAYSAHADLAHHSCTNSNCLMNHAAESGAQIGAFTAERIPELDDDCENDLKALGI